MYAFGIRHIYEVVYIDYTYTFTCMMYVCMHAYNGPKKIVCILIP